MLLLHPPPSSDIISEWVTFLTPIAIALLTVINLVIGKIQRNATKVVEAKAEEAKTVLATNNVITTNRLDQIHRLVNSEHGVTLRLAASALQRVADLTGKPEDQQLADEARRMSETHDNKQRMLDRHLESSSIDTDVPNVKATLHVDSTDSKKD